MAHTKLTPEVTEILCREVRDGATPQQACIAAGFSRNCWSNWCRKAEAGEDPYADAVDAIQRAEAMCLSDCAKAVKQARHEDWKAALAYLERRERRVWGAKLDLAVTKGDVDPDDLTDEEIVALMQQAANRGLSPEAEA